MLISPGQTSFIKVRQFIVVPCVAFASGQTHMSHVPEHELFSDQTEICHLQNFVTTSPVGQTQLVGVIQNYFPDGSGLSGYVIVPTGALLQSLQSERLEPAVALLCRVR